MLSTAVGFCSLFAVTAVAIYQWRRLVLRGLVLDRLAAPTEPTSARTGMRLSDAGPLRRRWLFLPYFLGALVSVGLYSFSDMALSFSLAFGLIVSMMGAELEAYFAAAQVARIEQQLADAIDLMIGALGAGTGVTNAMAAALEETRPPLRGQLTDLLGRIRLGDDPQAVFRSLAERVPLETFLLFSSTLAVHWEVGGSLAPTLASVGRTIRDRIEIGRRIQSNIAQSQISTVFLLLLTYFIAAVVWRNSPAQMRAFLGSDVGAIVVASSMILQALGIVWMSTTSKARF